MKYLQVCANGFIVLTSSYDGYHPENFPINISMISPFWADADTTPLYGNWTVWYRITTNETIKQRATSDVNTYFPRFKDFQASWILIATWQNVHYYGCRSRSGCLVIRRNFRFKLSVFHFQHLSLHTSNYYILNF